MRKQLKKRYVSPTVYIQRETRKAVIRDIATFVVVVLIAIALVWVLFNVAYPAV